MAEREVRYCTTEDGVRIAYRVEGEGPPLLVMPFLLESFSLEHLAPEMSEAIRRIGAGHEIIRFDTRGTGLSQREVQDMSNLAVLSDAVAVVDELKVGVIDVCGWSIGGARAAEFAAYHPERVRRLLLAGTFAKLTDVFPAEMLEGLAHLARANWELACRTLADLGTRRDSEELGLRLSEMYRRSTTGDVFAQFIESNVGYDLNSMLPRIKMPVLVVHRIDDQTYPLANAQKLVVNLPEGRLVALPGTNTTASLLGDDIVEVAREFLRNDDATHAKATAESDQSAYHVRTVLFTDIVSHTEMMSRLGDERGRAVLREHERITREVLKAHGGTEVKTMGDGFMASFGSVTRGVECAVALQRAFESRNPGDGTDRGVGVEQLRAEAPISDDGVAVAQPLRASARGQTSVEPVNVRVGLSAGEPIEEDGDLFGATVILASRIAARAEGGEILVADTVRGLCSGKGFVFADRGDFAAKGFEEPVRVYEVLWRE